MLLADLEHSDYADSVQGQRLFLGFSSDDRLCIIHSIPGKGPRFCFKDLNLQVLVFVGLFLIWIFVSETYKCVDNRKLQYIGEREIMVPTDDAH